ncbi:MAG: phosphonoacetate hydrolase [Candidatus Latescibacteria bacterium]|nr:phosphonoacetate hydrolase [Candidatus Latescibacterota bacterium]
MQVNQRTYQPRSQPVVGICLDGCAQEYLDAAAAHMPHTQALLQKGTHGLVNTVIPSFTNPNNMAIVTGAPPAVNGIPGNYYYDAEADSEVLMNDPKYLVAPTILAAFSQAGHRVAAVTTKDKLRLFLAQGLDGISFSVEKAPEATEQTHGISSVLELVGRPNPGIYDPEASVYCLEAGARLLASRPLDLLYLSTTDYVQHKYPPGSPEANQFYNRLDLFIGQLDQQGAILGITADHGMNDKVRADGSPNVQYLESLMADQGLDTRVILPITDPYVVHHGALGSYATVYLEADQAEQAAAFLRTLPGVEKVLDRAQAAAQYQLPPDRIGDLVVLADRHTVLGRTPDWHDLTAVEEGLRSHGGLHEGIVPLLVNRPLKAPYRQRLENGQLRNYDLFDLLFNGIEE